MAIFGVSVSNIDEDVINYFQDSHNRLQIGQGKFKILEGYIKRIKGSNVFLISMDVLFPKFYLYGIIYIISILILTNFNYNNWYWVGFLSVGTVIFYTRFFFFFILSIGLKKYTKNTSCKLINDGKVIHLLSSMT